MHSQRMTEADADAESTKRVSGFYKPACDWNLLQRLSGETARPVIIPLGLVCPEKRLPAKLFSGKFERTFRPLMASPIPGVLFLDDAEDSLVIFPAQVFFGTWSYMEQRGCFI